jgi:hypothetical protein
MVRQVTHFAKAIREQSAMSKRLRKIAYDALHCYIDNDDLLSIEQDIMFSLGWRYEGKDLDGGVKQRFHEGGCVKEYIVILKNTMLDPIRKALRNNHKEMLYERKNESGKKRAVGLVKYLDSTKESFGFIGRLSLFEGHPYLVGATKEKTLDEILKEVQEKLMIGGQADIEGAKSLLASLQSSGQSIQPVGAIKDQGCVGDSGVDGRLLSVSENEWANTSTKKIEAEELEPVHANHEEFICSPLAFGPGSSREFNSTLMGSMDDPYDLEGVGL